MEYKVIGAKFDNAARTMAVVGGFGMPVSTSLSAVGFSFMILFWLAGMNFKEKFKIIRENRQAVVATLLFGLFIVGILYSTADIKESLRVLSKYRELIYIPILASLFGIARWKNRAINYFCISMGLLLVASYAQYFGLIAYKHSTPGLGIVFVSRIAHGIFDAFFIFIMATKAFKENNKYWRMFYIVAAVIALINFVFMITGRTGYVVILVLFITFILLRFGKRATLFGLLMVPVLSLAAFYLSSNIESRIHRSIYELEQFEKGNDVTSIGERLSWYRGSTKLMLHHPVFGTGTGSFEKEFLEHSGEKPFPDQDSKNPHSVYFGLGVQLGLVGLGFYFYLLYLQLRQSNQQEGEIRYVAVAALITFIVSGLFNPMLYDDGGQFFAYFMGILLANTSIEKNLAAANSNS